MRHPLRLFKEMRQGVADSMELAWQLLLRDLKAQYRRSLLGMTWLLLAPIFTALIFIFLQSNQVLNISETDVPYPIFTLFGTILWQLFTASMLLPLKSFQINAQVLTKVNFPKESLVVAGMGQALFEAAVKLITLGGVMAYFLVSPDWGALYAVGALVLLMLLGYTIGLFLMPLGGLYKDVTQFITYLSILWFLVTPVVYPPPEGWPFSVIVRYNPVTPLLAGARSLALKGTLEDPLMFSVVACALVLLFPLAWVWYRISVPILVERMTN
jgi:lipopolysaccharide transport system permease protein